jgi:FAD/FMN-containing dehydrogenase
VQITELDREALRLALASQIAGEVRFDPVARALYSTDASVHQMEPLGVVVPRDRQDILRVLDVCRRLRIPVTVRGGGTSQAGQAIGEGLQIDISKHYHRILEVNTEEAWGRVEPGIVLDELSVQLAPLGMRFATDTSCRHPMSDLRDAGSNTKAVHPAVLVRSLLK